MITITSSSVSNEKWSELSNYYVLTTFNIFYVTIEWIL